MVPKPPALAAPVPDLASLPLSHEQAEKAIHALAKHSAAKASSSADTNLLAGGPGSPDSVVSLVVTLKRAAPREKHNPYRIALKHPLIDPRQSPVCLFTKDPQREYKDLLEEKKISFIAKVVGVSKLKGKHSSYEARRALLTSHSLFLTDERIIPLLPKLLGKTFFARHQQPLGVDLSTPNVKQELERAISSTSMRLPSGTCVNVKIGDLTLISPELIYDNLLFCLPSIVSRIPLGGWQNVQALHVKTGTSTSLPLWTSPLESGPLGRFSGPTEVEKLERQEAKERKEKRDDEVKEKMEKKREKEKKKRAREVEPEESEDKSEPNTNDEDVEVQSKRVKVTEGQLSLVDGSIVEPFTPRERISKFIEATTPNEVVTSKGKPKSKKSKSSNGPVTEVAVEGPEPIDQNDDAPAGNPKSKKLKSSNASVTEVVNEASKLIDQNGAVKPKSKKSKSSNGPVTEVVVEAPEARNQSDAVKLKSKKSKSSNAPVTEPVDETSKLIDQNDAVKPKSKKSNASVAEVVVEAPEARNQSDAVKLKSKKSKSSNAPVTEPVDETSKLIDQNDAVKPKSKKSKKSNASVAEVVVETCKSIDQNDAVNPNSKKSTSTKVVEDASDPHSVTLPSDKVPVTSKSKKSKSTKVAVVTDFEPEPQPDDVIEATTSSDKVGDSLVVKSKPKKSQKDGEVVLETKSLSKIQKSQENKTPKVLETLTTTTIEVKPSSNGSESVEKKDKKKKTKDEDGKFKSTTSEKVKGMGKVKVNGKPKSKK